jgi:acetyl-CoA synthase
MKVETLEDLKKPLEFARKLLPPHVKGKNHLPYLGPCWMPAWRPFSPTRSRKPSAFGRSRISTFPRKTRTWKPARSGWAPADDTILRKRGVEFVDGSAPVLRPSWARPDPETAKMIVEDYQKKNLYIFCAANQNGTTVIEQLLEAGVQIGWNTRIVPFGPDISSAVFALGSPTGPPWPSAASSPAITRRCCTTTRTAFSPLSTPSAMWAPNGPWRPPAASTGASPPWPTPTFPRSCPRVSVPTSTWWPTCPTTRWCQKSVEVRGLKVTVSEIDIPLSYGPAFEGERVRKDDLFMEMGGGKTQATELVKMAEMNEIEDGKVK